MSQSAPDLRSSRQIFRRYGTLVGAAVAASLLAGVATAAFSPVTVTSTALVALPMSTLTAPAAIKIADSEPVLAGALPELSPGTSLATVRGEVRVTSLTPYVLSVSVRAGTAAQAEVTANTIAESYIGYAGSAGGPAGHLPAILLQPAMSASGAARLPRLLAGALLGLACGALTGVIAAGASRRLTFGPLPPRCRPASPRKYLQRSGSRAVRAPRRRSRQDGPRTGAAPRMTGTGSRTGRSRCLAADRGCRGRRAAWGHRSESGPAHPRSGEFAPGRCPGRPGASSRDISLPAP